MGERLTGEVALVTGAAGGIGGAIVRRFEAEGCRVIAVDRAKPVDGTLMLVQDLGDDRAFDAIAQATQSARLSPTIVVHAAAIGDGCPTLSTTPEFLAEMFRVNVGAALRLAQLFAPAMQACGRGNFLFVSSINSTFATPGLAAYAASKAALDSLARTLALEFAPDGIRVNTLRPASVDTPLLRRGFDAAADPVAARAANIGRHPLGRLGAPDDIASLALFLCSNEAEWITGVDYLIDGGAATTRR